MVGTSSTQGSTESHPGGGIKNNQLPLGTDMTLWHQSFIMNVIQYVAQQSNPWAVPPLQIIPVMQSLWEVFFDGIPQTITATSVIYCLVSVVHTKLKNW